MQVDGFTNRALVVILLVVLVVIAGFVAVEVAAMLLVVFASVLLALLLNGLATLLQNATPLGYSWAVGCSALGLVALLGGFGWLIGPGVVDEFGQLSEHIPQSLEDASDVLEALPWLPSSGVGEQALESMLAEGRDQLTRVTSVVSSVLGTLAHIGLMLIIGFYIAVSPEPYQRGVLHLLPPNLRHRGRLWLDALGIGLKWWLLGRFASMVVVGVLTTVGLWIIGVPLALALGFIAGLFSFIPYIGPILSLVPALLIGVVEGPSLLLHIALVYGVVQVLESNLITPLIQKQAVSIPPAALITAQLIFGSLFGIVGLLVATPLVVALIITIQVCYIEGVLGEDILVLGEGHQRTNHLDAADEGAEPEEAKRLPRLPTAPVAADGSEA